MAPPDGKSREAARTGVGLAFLGTLIGASLVLFRRPSDRSHSMRSGRGEPSVAASAHAASIGYEPLDANAASIIKAAGLLGGSALLMIGLMIVLLNVFDASTARRDANLTPEQRTRVQVPSPHLQAAPYDELHDERARENARLTGYAWRGADRSHARIPLARAMVLTVGRSLDFGPDGPPAPSGTAGQP